MTPSTLFRSASRCSLSGVAALTFALLPTIAAHADVKIVSETTITGISDAPAPASTTVYYKGEKQRTEMPDRVTIYDCAADALYTLDAKSKTYTVATGEAAANNVPKSPLASMMKIETKEATLTPVPGTKNVAGKSASSYAYMLVIHLTPSDPSLSDFVPSLTATVKGVQWTTETAAAPMTCDRMARMNIARVLPGTIASMGNGLKDLSSKISQIKGLFLTSRIEFTIKPDKAGDATIPLPKDPIIVTTEVKSLSEDPLDDSLFAVPADYKKLETPPAAATGAGAPAAATTPATAPAGSTTK